MKRWMRISSFFIIFCLCPLASGSETDNRPFDISDPGTEKIVDYQKYGEFKGIGTSDYQFIIKDWEGLSKATGEGIYPNNYSIYNSPYYRTLLKERRLIGTRWDYTNDPDVLACYFKWATEEQEDEGVKQFYIAMQLERAGYLERAVKAYYSIIVHFPKAIGWTYYQTPWPVGFKALEKILFITRRHPELNLHLDGTDIIIKNCFDNDVTDDKFIVNPGRIAEGQLPKKDIKLGEIKKTLGGDISRIVQFENGYWQFQIKGKPTLLKVIAYEPAPVGNSPDEGTLSSWMTYDSNGNGILDCPYESFVDKNRNNKQDENEPTVGDFQLLKEMGCNVIRVYHHGFHPVEQAKKVLREAYEKYGLYTIMGDFIGMYTVGSGASWEEGTDYRDEAQKANMLNSVKQMIDNYKDEPYVIMWMLGNENNYGSAIGHVGGQGNAGKYPDTFYSFVNDLAQYVHSADPKRPVAICNGDVLYLDHFAKHCGDVDIFGLNSYRGSDGFGISIWRNIKDHLDRPAMITEYGCPAFHERVSFEEAEVEQMEYHKGNWDDILYNSYKGDGQGTAIGGVCFQWIDGWWKSGQPPRYSPVVQENLGQWPGPFPGGWGYEEFLGICSQGDGTKTPFLRVPRKAYDYYKEAWNKD
ncbi:MAG: hypothetical protein JW928_01785 [Candidatus Aureabacteria bacterium]|nr:hypothetical protein [Candidatus Auribacterota bacterium]